jgi:hypothetical protein
MKPKHSLTHWYRSLYLLILLAVMPLQAMATGPLAAEYKLKAALIYKLTRFVEWPVEGRGKPRDQFNICILGRDVFDGALDALNGREVNGSPITIQRYTRSNGISESCQIVFISASKQAFLQPILQSFEQRPILTISDTEQFAEKGGMIQFTRGGKRIGFRINLDQARASGLKIAAPLLELATIVDTGNKGDEP